MTLDKLILELVAQHSVDAASLRRSLPDESGDAIEAALDRLVAAGAVERVHVQTLPPRTLYRARGRASS